MEFYDYEYEFADAEVYAATWTRKKIEFLNFVAIEWGGIIKEFAEGKCQAPLESADLEVIALC